LSACRGCRRNRRDTTPECVVQLHGQAMMLGNFHPSQVTAATGHPLVSTTIPHRLTSSPLEGDSTPNAPLTT